MKQLYHGATCGSPCIAVFTTLYKACFQTKVFIDNDDKLTFVNMKVDICTLHSSDDVQDFVKVCVRASVQHRKCILYIEY